MDANKLFEERNEELQERFDEWANVEDSEKADWKSVEKLVESDDETAGIAAHNGVLCWYTEGYAGFAEDTPENREIAGTQWEKAMAEIEEDTKFYINYGTGAGNETAKTLDEAMQKAVEGARYTQQSISIEDKDDKVVACLPWYGVKATEDDVVTVDYGDFGFYGEWQQD